MSMRGPRARARTRAPRKSTTVRGGLYEGLYIKQEDRDFVLRRFKWIRPTFLAHIAASNEHWRARDELLNRLANQ